MDFVYLHAEYGKARRSRPNQADGTFADPIFYVAGDGARSVTAADLDGDGRPDLATANHFSLDVSVLLNACLL
ncbi:FG-GAP repeat domain-containing protein [Sorangium sp. So ce388]|uniref:FG-GAP repeat domain-containing protein n=1 Tax=Sorangium sp. So ce388 TaxID=3133309 RepID=UPI003F5C4DBC